MLQPQSDVHRTVRRRCRHPGPNRRGDFHQPDAALRAHDPERRIHIENLTYWHDDPVALRKLTPPTKDGKWVVRRDPYDPDRVWVQHPATGEWLECVSESYRRDGYPFASGLRLLRDMPEADGIPAEEWATEQLARTSSANNGQGRAKRSEKAHAVRARREAEAEPRPAPATSPAPPTAKPPSADQDGEDFAVLRTGDRLWND